MNPHGPYSGKPIMAPIPGADGVDGKNWLEYVHPLYRANVERWVYAEEHYNGDILRDDRIANYLIKRQIGESVDAWQERMRLVDLTNHHATVVDSLAGMLFAKEADANRKFSDSPDSPNSGLGSIDDPSTPIGKLWIDADGLGTGLMTLMKQVAVQLIVTHRCWLFTDSPTGSPRVHVLSPVQVSNWLYDKEDGSLSECLMKSVYDTRTSLEDKIEENDQYLRFTREGWTTWQTVKGKPVRVEGPGTEGTYSFVDRAGRPALPLFQVELPMRRPVGYLLARKQNAILNMESGRDFLLWTANFPKLMLAADDTLFLKIIASLREGSNVLQEDLNASKNHHYEAPPTESASIASEVLKRKVEEFYITAFREYGDAGRERTATEVNQDVASGVGAFLQMLKAALDDAENNIYARVEQILFPGNPNKWFVSSVQRSDDFAPSDVAAMIQRMQKRYFGETEAMPVGRSAQIAVAKQAAGWEGVDVSDGEISVAVDLANLRKNKELLGDFSLPPKAKAKIAMKILEDIGVVAPLDPRAQDAEVQAARDEMEELLEEAAAEQDEQKKAEAEFLKNPPTEGPPDEQDVPE